MQKTQKDTYKLIKSDDFINQEMKLLNHKVMNNKNEKFPSPKNIEDLHKVLKFKNQKISQEIQHNHFSIEEIKYSQARRIAEYQHKFLTKNGEKKRPIHLLDQYSVDQQFYNDGKNTLALLKISEELKKQLTQDSQFFEIVKNQKRYPFKTKIKLKHTFFNPKKLQLSYDEKQLYAQLKKQDLEFDKKQQKRLEIKQEQKSGNELKIYEEFEDYFSRSYSTNLKLDDMQKSIQMYTKSLKLNKEKIYWIFFCQLIKKFRNKIVNNVDILKFQFGKSKNFYYQKCCAREASFKSYTNMRLHLLMNTIYKDYSGDMFEREQTQDFWIKCLMFFFSNQKCEQRLIEQLTGNGYLFYLNALQDFYRCEEVKNKTELKQRVQFSQSYFYRILTKIILNQRLTESQQKLLFQDQRQYLIMLKLLHIKDFHKSMQFKQTKQKLYKKFHQAINKNDERLLNEAINKLLTFMCFDQVFYDFFLSNRKYIKDHQLLVTFQILLRNPKLIRFSNYPLEDWLSRFFQFVESFLTKKEIKSEEKSLVLMIRMMSVLRRYLPEKQFVEKLQYVFQLREGLLRLFMDHDSWLINATTLQFSLDLNILQEIILKSLKTNEDYQQFITLLLSPSIEFDSIQSREIAESQENNNKNKKINYQKYLRNPKHFSLKYYQKSYINRQQKMFFVRNNKLLPLGIKICIKYLIKLIHQQSSNYQSQQFQNIVFFIKKILNITGPLAVNTNNFLSNFVAQSKIELKESPQTQEYIKRLYRQNNEPQDQTFSNMETSFFQPKTNPDLKEIYNQWKTTLAQIQEIHLIPFIFINYIYLSLDYKGQNRQTIFTLIKYSAMITSKYQNSSKNAWFIFCENLQKQGIADKAFLISFLMKISLRMERIIEDIGIEKQRKLRSIQRDFDFRSIKEYLQELEWTLQYLKKQ